MSQDQIANAVKSDSSAGGSTSSTVVEPEQPQKGRRTRRVSTKERVSKVPNTPGRRSSIYRGVTRHRWTGRYEAHLWDKSCWNQSQNKKGRQVYLGAYDDEEAAARAYDLAALKYWGAGTIINFPLTDYTKELEGMRDVSKEEYLASLRRKSSGFSRGVSKYRGVARHHHNGRWEARIGRIFGNKYLYLGTYSTQEEAAAAYDMAAIEYRGLNAVTNFDLSRYIRWLRPGQAGNAIAVADPSGIPAPQMQQSFTPAMASTELSVPDQMEQSTGIWDASQACGEAYNQLATASAQSNNSSGSALGLLLQSGIFKQMLDRASVIDGVAEQALVDQSPDQSQSDPSQDDLLQSMNVDSVKNELSFQEEVRHVFDHPEMPLVPDQVDHDDLSGFGHSSNLDRMFFQSDMSFPYLPINPTPSEMMDQGAALLDSVISPFNSLSLPYAISTCS